MLPAPQLLSEVAAAHNTPPSSSHSIANNNNNSATAASSASSSSASYVSPSGWSSHLDSSSGKVYYANQNTGESSWVKPSDFHSPSTSSEDSHSDDPLSGSDWAKILDATSGKYYYANRKTLATSWNVPVEIQRKSVTIANVQTESQSPASSPANANISTSSSSPSSSPSPSPSSSSSPPSQSVPPPSPSTTTITAAASANNEAIIPPPFDYERVLDPTTQRYYYVHLPTRSVSWQSPEAFRAFEDQEKRLRLRLSLSSSGGSLNNNNDSPTPSSPNTTFTPVSSPPVDPPPSASPSSSTTPPSLLSSLENTMMSPKKGAKPPPMPSSQSKITSPPSISISPPSQSHSHSPSPSLSGLPSTPSNGHEEAKEKRLRSDSSGSGSFGSPTSSSPSSSDVFVDDEEARAAALALGGGSVQLDKHGNPVLPPSIKSEIAKFQLTGFASEHFRVFKKKTGIMSSRKVSVAEILSWQKNCIEKSLLASAKKYSSQAVGAFSLIQNFMGDVPSKKTPAALAKELIALAISKPTLRDEIFSQLCKQTKNNPDVKSTANGWKLLAFSVVNFAPTRSFQEYLLKYFLDNYALSSHLAPFCYWRLLKTLKEGPEAEGTFALSTVESFAEKGVPSWFVTFQGSIEYIIQLQAKEGLSTKVPDIMIRLCTFIKNNGGFQAKGIFRIAAQREHVNELKSHIEKGNYDLLGQTKGKVDFHTAADVLKVWLRGLYETIIPSELYEKCLLAADNANSCLAVTNELPRAHYDSLDYLLTFLIDLSSQSSVNLMNEENISIVFCQDLLREPSIVLKEKKEKDGSTSTSSSASSSTANLSMALMNSNKEKNFVKHLLEQWKKGNKGNWSGPKPKEKENPKEKEKANEEKQKPKDTKKK